jgi:hypothetical protein
MKNKPGIAILIHFLVGLTSCVNGQSESPIEIQSDRVVFKTSSIFGARGSRARVLIPSDIKTFQWIDGFFSKDKEQVYYFNLVLTQADPNSFTALSKVDAFHELDLFPDFKSVIGIDKNSIFIMQNFNQFLDSVAQVEEILPRQSFKIISVLDSTDCVFFVQCDNKLYQLYGDMYRQPQIRLYPFKPNHYKILGGRFIRSGSFIYYHAFPMEGIDASKFETFGNSGYYKHKNAIFHTRDYSTNKVENADAETFEVHNILNFLAKDKHRYFDEEQQIQSDSAYGFSLKEIFTGKVDRATLQELKTSLLQN